MAGGGSMGSSYSVLTGGIIMFNMVVGAGALTMPLTFLDAGIFLSLIFIFLIAAISYVTCTYVVEAHALVNAFHTINSETMGRPLLDVQSASGTNAHSIPLLEDGPAEAEAAVRKDTVSGEVVERRGSGVAVAEEKTEYAALCHVNTRVEVGEMAETFLTERQVLAFNVMLILYLFGDLSIYAVSIPKTLADVAGGGDDGYYLYLLGFAAVTVPFTFFDFQKTKYLQLVTMTCRNVAFFMMIIIALIFVADGDGASLDELEYFDITGLPVFFGSAVYSFMNHHSLPGIVTPVNRKDKVTRMLATDYSVITVIYTLFCFATTFAFGAIKKKKCSLHPGAACHTQDLVTLNYASYHVRGIADYLALFPVFTLTTNFPLMAITLRNNLMNILPWFRKGSQFARFRVYIFAIIATTPSLLIAFATKDLDILVAITGSYTGLAIMFVFPTMVVVAARAWFAKAMPGVRNPHASMFAGERWTKGIYIWSGLCVCLSTVNLILRIGGWD